MDQRRKDWWDKTQISSQLALAVVALCFTFLFGWKQQDNANASLKLAESNFAVARDSLKSSLIPFLASDNAKQRAMALRLAESLDPPFAAEAARLLAVADPEPSVRRTAISALSSLSKGKSTPVARAAREGVDEYNVMNELRSKDLLRDVSRARTHLDLDNALDQETALKIYRSTLEKLSPSSKAALNQALLNAAEAAYKSGRNSEAIQKYTEMFANFRQLPE